MLILKTLLNAEVSTLQTTACVVDATSASGTIPDSTGSTRTGSGNATEAPSNGVLVILLTVISALSLSVILLAGLVVQCWINH